MSLLRKKLILKITTLFVVFFIIILSLVIINEQKASRNILVSISKRLVAELGAFCVNRIYDPRYIGNGYINFGPENQGLSLVNNQDKRDELLLFLKNELNAKVIKYNNITPSAYALNFDYQPFDSEKLTMLREKYKLKEITDRIDNEFKKILFLRNWVKSSWEHGFPKNVDYNFNALDILKRAKQGERFFCSEYSTVFVQCALSIGLQARYLGLFKGHVVAEVWSNELCKWVVMDVDNNLHYMMDGIPLNALELHNLWEFGNWNKVCAFQGLEEKMLDSEKLKFLLSFYHEFYVRMRNDWFSKKYPHWHPKANSIMNALEWSDDYTSNNILVARETKKKEELYFSLNVTSLNIVKTNSSKDQIQLILNTFTPNFSNFIIQIDKRQPIKQEKYDLLWNIHDGQNRIRCQAVNNLGVKGPVSEVIFYFKKL